ncbi:tetratricopeptide repeat protein [Stappia sp. WLB 29]|uniref:tetratricopeptide repeat protein n=1 Tax=Stappia sp. WLB 29 TaxID=2925220 RepID=UPI0020BEF054|nr:tetratricopeptide repeat protein [Stappia sp. WLB 29]
MTITDAYGYPLTLSDAGALQPWRGAVRAFLAHGRATPDLVAETLRLAPDFAFCHAVHGLFCMLLGRREMVAVAAEDLERARTAAAAVGVSPREAAVVNALGDWLAGHPARAGARLDAALADHPADPLLMKLVHAIRFVLGDAAGMRRSLAGVEHAFAPDHPERGYFLGCQAFALEETGDYALAERVGREAVALAPDDAWGLHAVAHVYDMTARVEDGRAWLEANTAAFSHCNNFRFHVWWHLALMYLERGDVSRVLELYDEEIRAERTDDYRDISNAASLLVRLEIEGVNVGGRWDELARLAEARVDDRCNIFADLHYMLSLEGGDRRDAADALIASMGAHAGEETDMGRIAAAAGMPAVLGLEAWARGNYFSAFRHLDRARPQLFRIGGSHAQRDVFERLAIEAALRAGLCLEAERLLRERVTLRGGLDRFAEVRLERAERMRLATRLMQDEALRAVPA